MSSTDPAGFRFRDYQAGDFHRLCELDRICFPEGVSYTPQEIALALLQPGSFALVAERRGRLVAFVLAAHARRGLGHLVTIDVEPEFRRRKIGERLMELAEQRLKQDGAIRLVLEVAVHNESARAFYSRRGFAFRRLLPRYYRDGSDAWLMEKAL